MQRSKIPVGLVAPLVMLLSVAGPAFSQQAVPEEKKGTGSVNEARELEAEIEQYPGPNDGVMTEPDTRIPEAIQPKPKKPSVEAAPAPLPGAEPRSSSAAQPTGIDPKEIQRVFGQDALVLDLDTLDAAQVTRLQTRLRELGHYLGVIDGIVGPKTRAALRAVIADQFALSQRLLRQNQLTTDLAAQVGLGSRGFDANPTEGVSPAPRPSPSPAPPLP